MSKVNILEGTSNPSTAIEDLILNNRREVDRVCSGLGRITWEWAPQVSVYCNGYNLYCAHGLDPRKYISREVMWEKITSTGFEIENGPYPYRVASFGCDSSGRRHLLVDYIDRYEWLIPQGWMVHVLYATKVICIPQFRPLPGRFFQK